MSAYRVQGTPTAVMVSPDGRIGSVAAAGAAAVEPLIRGPFAGTPSTPIRRRPMASRFPEHASERTLEQFARRVREGPGLRRLDTLAVEAFDAFDGAGVEALLLKGPALARVLYAPTEHRGYSDVDVLVAPRDAGQAREVLRALGYVALPEQLGIDDIGRQVDAETWARGGSTQDAGLMIDLHRQLFGAEAEPGIAFEALRVRRAWMELGSRHVPTVDRVGLAVHVALHAAQHGARYEQPMEDLDMAVSRWPPEVWHGAERLAAAMRATPAFAAGLRQRPSGAALAGQLGLPASDELLWEIANRASRPPGTFHLRAFGEATSVRERASVLRRALVPSRRWMAWRYPWAREGGARLCAAYGLHAARSPLWAGAGVAVRAPGRLTRR